MPKIFISPSVTIGFQFDKYIDLILRVIPKNDIIGLSEIRIVNKFSQKQKYLNNSLACYVPNKDWTKNFIEINAVTIIETKKIPQYLFEDYPDIAALFLSEILAHEIGHHVHRHQRHSIKKNAREQFADNYATAGYYYYFKSNSSKILSSYKKARWNIFNFDKEQRKMISSTRKELIEWVKNNEGKISFP